MADYTSKSALCVVCGKSERIMKRCTGCQETFYCSKECQRLHWGKHKKTCLVDKSLGKSYNMSESEKEVRDLIKVKNSKAVTESIPSVKVEMDETLTGHNAGKKIVISTSDLSNSHEQSNCSSMTANKIADQMSDCQNVQEETSQVSVHVKFAKTKQKLHVTLPCSGSEAFATFSRATKVPADKLKLIFKGKLQTESNIVKNLVQDAVFLAFGEVAENEEGLETSDIELIMTQLSVDRNVAIKALRKTSCLLDAIFEIGNDL